MGLSRRKFTGRRFAVNGAQTAVTASYNISDSDFILKRKKKKTKTVWYFQITSYLEVESGYVATRPLVAGANTVCRELWEARSAGIELDPLPIFQCFSLS